MVQALRGSQTDTFWLRRERLTEVGDLRYPHNPAKRLARLQARMGQLRMVCSVSTSTAALACIRSDCWELTKEKLQMIASVALFFPEMS